MKTRNVILLSLGLVACTAHAATRTWDGGGTNFSWGNITNWNGDTAIAAGDALVFPNGVTQRVASNNVATFEVHSLTFSGTNYILPGQQIRVLGGITNSGATGTNIISAPTVAPSNNIHIINSGNGRLSFPTQLLSVSNVITFAGNGPIDVAGNMNFPGRLSKTGFGALTLSGQGPVAPVELNLTNLQGATTLNGPTIARLHLDGGTVLGTGQVRHVVVGAGELNPGPGAGLGKFSVAETALFSPASVLTIDLNGPGGAGVGHDQLVVGDTLEIDNATLDLQFGYAPALGEVLTIVRNASGSAVIGEFNGLPEGAEINIGSRLLTISYQGGDGNDVELTVTGILPTGVTRVWRGTGTNLAANLWSLGTNWTGGFAPISGDRVLFPEGMMTNQLVSNNLAGLILDALIFSGTNQAQFRGLELGLLNSLIVSNNGGLTSGSCTLPLRLEGEVWFLQRGTSAPTTTVFTGPVALNGHTLNFSNRHALRVDSVISGAGAITGRGGFGGLLILTATNTFDGPVNILGGGLNVQRFALGTTNSPTHLQGISELRINSPFNGPLAEPLVLDARLNYSSGAALEISGAITNNFSQTDIERQPGAGDLRFSGPFRGSRYIFFGPGTVIMSSPSLQAAELDVLEGRLFLESSGTNTAIHLADDTLLGGDGAADIITYQNVSDTGTINPGSNSIARLTTRLLLAQANMTNVVEFDHAGGNVHDQLRVHQTVSLASMKLRTAASATFAPAVGESFKIVDNTGPQAVGGTFGGLPEGATLAVTNPLGSVFTFTISYAGGDGNDVTLTRTLTLTGNTRVWRGTNTGVQANRWSVATNWIGNVAPVSGDSVQFNNTLFSGQTVTNDLAGLVVNDLLLGNSQGAYFRGLELGLMGRMIFSNNTAFMLNDYFQIPLRLEGPVTLAQTDTNNAPLAHVNGAIDLRAHTLTISNAARLTLFAPVGGTGGIVKTGPGLLLLEATNTFEGTVTVSSGELFPVARALGSTNSPTVIETNGLLQALTLDGPLAEPLTLAGTIRFGNAGQTREFSGPITAAGGTVQAIDSLATILVSGPVSGGNLRLFGLGTKIVSSHSTAGATFVARQGPCFINGTNPFSPVRLETCLLGGHGHVGAVSAESPSSRPTLNPGHDAIGTLTTGDLIQRANWTNVFEMANQGVNVTDRLRVLGSVNLSNANLRLVLSNSFAPEMGESFTIIENDGTDAVNGQFFDLQEGVLLGASTPAGSNFVFRLSYVGGDGNDVVLTREFSGTGSTRFWTGLGANNLWSTPANWSNSIAPASGDALRFPPGAARRTNQNDFPAGRAFAQLTVHEDYEVGGAGLRLAGGLNITNTGARPLAVKLPLTLLADQTFDLSQSSNLRLDGDIDLGAHQLRIHVSNGAAPIHFNGVIQGAGSVRFTGNRSVQLSRANTYTGPTFVESSVGFVLHPQGLGSPSGGTIVSNQSGLAFASLLTEGAVIAEPLDLRDGSLQFNPDSGSTNVTNIVWAAPVSVQTTGTVRMLSIGTTIARTLAMTQPFSGSGWLGFLGATANNTLFNTIRLDADSPFTGDVSVRNRLAVEVNGAWPAATWTVESNLTTLAGTGLVRALTLASGAVLSPAGESAGDGTASTLTVTQSLVMQGTSVFRVHLGGAAVANYDQVDVLGTVDLGAGTAGLDLQLTFAPAPGQTFVILDNDGTDAVNGSFAGRPEGALLTNQFAGSNYVFQISYAGGSGNDVTLTVLGGNAPPSVIQFSGVNSNGLFTLTGAGFSNAPYVLEATTNLNTPIPWQPIATNFSSGGGLYQFIDPNSTNFPIRFYRVQSP